MVVRGFLFVVIFSLNMGDDNVMNQYYPPDFDPAKMLPVKAFRPKRTPGPRQMSIRMMMPFTMRCSNCEEYMYIATKFNSKCEKIQGTTALGLNAYRFFGDCKHCKKEFSFRTDPEHSDYVLESGGTRTYEAFKDADFAQAEVAKAKALEAENETVALENKIYDTAEEMRRIEELGELRSINKREAKRHQVIDDAIEKIIAEATASQSLIDEQEAEEEFRTLKKQIVATNVSAPSKTQKPSTKPFSTLGIKIKPKS